jgi:hypothetical protein
MRWSALTWLMVGSIAARRFISRLFAAVVRRTWPKIKTRNRPVVVAAIAFVDVDALHINAGVPLDVGDSGLERVPVEGIVVKRLGMQDELTAFGLVGAMTESG